MILKRLLMWVGAAAAALAVAAAAVAVTPNFPLGASVQTFPFLISGQRTATVVSVVRFKMPFACTLVGASATARASGGTSPTLTVDVLEGGTTVLAAPIAVTAAAVAEGTITDSAIADEALITMTITIAGTSPTWDDIAVLLTCVR